MPLKKIKPGALMVQEDIDAMIDAINELEEQLGKIKTRLDKLERKEDDD